MLPEEALFKGGASLISGTIGVFVLAGSRKRAANVFLSAFLFLLAGNQFAEAMRVLAPDKAGRLLWFRIASVFAFLDPLALYAFGSVFPERNRLNTPARLGAVCAFSVGLALTAPFLELASVSLNATEIILTTWALGTVVIYGSVLREAIRQVRLDPSESVYAELVPALCVITVPAVARGAQYVGRVLPVGETVVASGMLRIQHLFVGFAVLAVAAVLLRQAWALDGSVKARRLVAVGAFAGLVFALLSKQGTMVNIARSFGWELALGPLMAGVGGALKLIVFGVMASAAILRNRILDLSLGTRRWAARVLGGVFVIASMGGVAALTSSMVGTSPALAEPGLWTLLIVVFISTQGFRTLVDAIAEKAYAVPRSSRRHEQIEAYRAAVEQAVEEDRGLGSDPRLRRLREELDLDDRTAHVLERMAGSSSGGPLQPDETIEGRYRIDAFVGRGSSGRTFRAHDELLDRDVAIKEVLHGGPHESARALEEARMAGRLDHPNIVTLHDVITRPGASLLVTEYVDGPTLAEKVDAKGPLSLEEVLDALDGILSGLEAVHAQDVVHGDLKPDNVLLDQGATPKIADFGTSRIADGGTRHAGDRTSLSEGTPAYMAPEQKAGRSATKASDLYAAGLVANEIAREPLPEPVQAVVETACADDPADRFASASEMREALREAEQARFRSGR